MFLWIVFLSIPMREGRARLQPCRLAAIASGTTEVVPSQLETGPRLRRRLLRIGEQEIEHQLIEVGGFFDLRKVSAVVDHLQAGIGDAAVHSLALSQRNKRILATPYEQCRRLHAA